MKLTGNRCRCPRCGSYFSTVSNFDRHRKGKHGVDRHCVEPATVGLVATDMGGELLWKMPRGGYVRG